VDILSKREKKIARELIEKGLLIEFGKILEEAGGIIEDWKNKKTDNRAAYYLLFDSVKTNDKHIARRYDGLTGSRYIFTVAGLLADGIISEEDIQEFRKEVQDKIHNINRI
jgi:hypothetical protein